MAASFPSSGANATPGARRMLMGKPDVASLDSFFSAVQARMAGRGAPGRRLAARDETVSLAARALGRRWLTQAACHLQATETKRLHETWGWGVEDCDNVSGYEWSNDGRAGPCAYVSPPRQRRAGAALCMRSAAADPRPRRAEWRADEMAAHGTNRREDGVACASDTMVIPLLADAAVPGGLVTAQVRQAWSDDVLP